MSSPCKCVLLLFTEKELNELLKEVFDGYESDASETAATADADVELVDVQLPAADDIDTQTEQSSKALTPGMRRSRDRGGHDDDDVTDATCSSQHEAENYVFHYPGHIPPLK